MRFSGFKLAKLIPLPRPARLALAGAGLLLAMLLMLVAAAAFMLPRAGAYKAQVEHAASQAIGRPVFIDAISARWAGINPELQLQGLRIQNLRGDVALQLPSVLARLSWTSLAALSPRLATLEISGAQLDIERDEDGDLFVGGIFIDPDKKGDGSGLDWLLRQDRILLRNGALRWRDQTRRAPDLLLSGLQISLENAWLDHHFKLDALPPAELAGPFSLRADFSHSPLARRLFSPRQWSGKMQLQWRDADLAAWSQWIEYPIALTRGRGALSVALGLEDGRLKELDTELDLRDVQVRLKPDLPRFDLASAHGALALRSLPARSGDGRQPQLISLRELSLVTADGLTLPPTTVEHESLAGNERQTAQTRLHVSTLDIGMLARLAAYLPLPADQRALLADLAPQGQLRDISAQWEGSYPKLQAWKVKGAFRDLGMAPLRWPIGADAAQANLKPGFSGISGSVEADQLGGRLKLSSTHAMLRLPGVLDQEGLHFEKLQAETQWDLRQGLALSLRDAHFVQEGVSAQLSLQHRQASLAAGAPGESQFDLHLDEVDLRKLPRYLPNSLAPALRHAVGEVLQGGRLRELALHAKGDFQRLQREGLGAMARSGARTPGQTELTLSASLAGGQLALPLQPTDGRAAPVIADVAGRLELQQGRLAVQVDQARSGALALKAAHFTVPDLFAAERELQVQAQAAGPLKDLLALAAASPLAAYTANMHSSGDAMLALDMRLPLSHVRQARVKGSFKLAGNDLRFGPGVPGLDGASGEIQFTERSFDLVGLRTRFLGAPLQLAGGTQADGAIALQADGQLSAQGLRELRELPWLQSLAPRLQGETAYRLTVKLKEGALQAAFESSLQGLALNLPAPLTKPASASLPLALALDYRPAAGSGKGAMPEQLQVRAQAGEALRAAWHLRRQGQQHAGWQRVSGALGINAPLPDPQAGVAININLDKLDLDAWAEAMRSLPAGEQKAAVARPAADPEASVAAKAAAKAAEKAAANAAANAAAKAETGAVPLADLLMPDAVSVRAAEIVVGGRHLRNIVAGATRSGAVWQANLDAEQAAGYLRYEAQDAQGKPRIHARLTRLQVPASEAQGFAPPSAASAPRKLRSGTVGEISRPLPLPPSLDIEAEEVSLLGNRLGRVALLAQRIDEPSRSVWKLENFSIANEDAVLKADGSVETGAAGGASRLRFALDVLDGGRLLTRMGQAGLVAGSSGRMQGELAWRGAPFTLDLPSLSGKLEFALQEGRFLKVDPGAGRLIGLLSLQTLPRRMALDFDDVFSPGFRFDRAAGSATIEKGVMRADNLKMNSATVAVALDGWADLGRQQQDLHVLILPQFDAGSASVAVGMLVNPVIGLTTLLAQMLLHDPMMAALSREYRLSGSWDTPVVQRLKEGKPMEGEPEPLPGPARAD